MNGSTNAEVERVFARGGDFAPVAAAVAIAFFGAWQTLTTLDVSVLQQRSPRWFTVALATHVFSGWACAALVLTALEFPELTALGLEPAVDVVYQIFALAVYAGGSIYGIRGVASPTDARARLADSGSAASPPVGSLPQPLPLAPLPLGDDAAVVAIAVAIAVVVDDNEQETRPIRSQSIVSADADANQGAASIDVARALEPEFQHHPRLPSTDSNRDAPRQQSTNASDSNRERKGARTDVEGERKITADVATQETKNASSPPRAAATAVATDSPALRSSPRVPRLFPSATPTAKISTRPPPPPSSSSSSAPSRSSPPLEFPPSPRSLNHGERQTREVDALERLFLRRIGSVCAAASSSPPSTASRHPSPLILVSRSSPPPPPPRSDVKIGRSASQSPRSRHELSSLRTMPLDAIDEAAAARPVSVSGIARFESRVEPQSFGGTLASAFRGEVTLEAKRGTPDATADSSRSRVNGTDPFRHRHRHVSTELSKSANAAQLPSSTPFPESSSGGIRATAGAAAADDANVETPSVVRRAVETKGTVPDASTPTFSRPPPPLSPLLPTVRAEKGLGISPTPENREDVARLRPNTTFGFVSEATLAETSMSATPPMPAAADARRQPEPRRVEHDRRPRRRRHDGDSNDASDGDVRASRCESCADACRSGCAVVAWRAAHTFYRVRNRLVRCRTTLVYAFAVEIARALALFFALRSLSVPAVADTVYWPYVAAPFAFAPATAYAFALYPVQSPARPYGFVAARIAADLGAPLLCVTHALGWHWTADTVARVTAVVAAVAAATTPVDSRSTLATIGNSEASPLVPVTGATLRWTALAPVFLLAAVCAARLPSAMQNTLYARSSRHARIVQRNRRLETRHLRACELDRRRHAARRAAAADRALEARFTAHAQSLDELVGDARWRAYFEHTPYYPPVNRRAAAISAASTFSSAYFAAPHGAEDDDDADFSVHEWLACTPTRQRLLTTAAAVAVADHRRRQRDRDPFDCAHDTTSLSAALAFADYRADTWCSLDLVAVRRKLAHARRLCARFFGAAATTTTPPPTTTTTPLFSRRFRRAPDRAAERIRGAFGSSRIAALVCERLEALEQAPRSVHNRLEFALAAEHLFLEAAVGAAANISVTLVALLRRQDPIAYSIDLWFLRRQRRHAYAVNMARACAEIDAGDDGSGGGGGSRQPKNENGGVRATVGVDDCDEEETLADIRRTHSCCSARERDSCIVVRLDRSAEYPRSSCIHTNAPSPVELEHATRWLARLRPPPPPPLPPPLIVSVMPNSAPTVVAVAMAISLPLVAVEAVAATLPLEAPRGTANDTTLVAKRTRHPTVAVAAPFAPAHE